MMSAEDVGWWLDRFVDAFGMPEPLPSFAEIPILVNQQVLLPQCSRYALA